MTWLVAAVAVCLVLSAFLIRAVSKATGDRARWF